MSSAADLDKLTLYQAIGPEQFQCLVRNNWQRLTAAADDVRFCLLPLQQRHAEMMARRLLVPAMGAAYVIRLELPGQWLGRYPLETVAYEEHLEFRISAEEMEKVSDRLLGKVQLVAVFLGQHSYSIPSGYRWRNRLTA